MLDHWRWQPVERALVHANALHEQLVSRKTENDEELNRRWAAVQEEMKASGEFNYQVQNPFGNPDKAVDDIERIIELAHREQAVRPIGR